jgi:hypothetical protein
MRKSDWFRRLFSEIQKSFTGFETCAVCHRRLRDEKSRELGIGPTCARKLPKASGLEKRGQMRLF